MDVIISRKLPPYEYMWTHYTISAKLLLALAGKDGAKPLAPSPLGYTPVAVSPGVEVTVPRTVIRGYTPEPRSSPSAYADGRGRFIDAFGSIEKKT